MPLETSGIAFRTLSFQVVALPRRLERQSALLRAVFGLSRLAGICSASRAGCARGGWPRRLRLQLTLQIVQAQADCNGVALDQSCPAHGFAGTAGGWVPGAFQSCYELLRQWGLPCMALSRQANWVDAWARLCSSSFCAMLCLLGPVDRCLHKLTWVGLLQGKPIL